MDEGKPAITNYRWLQLHERRPPGGGQREKFSLLELTPLTGRTHQLRVHLAEQLGLPIVGDYRYFSHQPPHLDLHLHCYRVTLHNWLGPGKDLTIKAPIPPHFVATMHSHPIKIDEPPRFARK